MAELATRGGGTPLPPAGLAPRPGGDCKPRAGLPSDRGSWLHPARVMPHRFDHAGRRSGPAGRPPASRAWTGAGPAVPGTVKSRCAPASLDGWAPPRSVSPPERGPAGAGLAVTEGLVTMSVDTPTSRKPSRGNAVRPSKKPTLPRGEGWCYPGPPRPASPPSTVGRWRVPPHPQGDRGQGLKCCRPALPPVELTVSPASARTFRLVAPWVRGTVVQTLGGQAPAATQTRPAMLSLRSPPASVPAVATEPVPFLGDDTDRGARAVALAGARGPARHNKLRGLLHAEDLPWCSPAFLLSCPALRPVPPRLPCDLNRGPPSWPSAAGPAPRWYHEVHQRLRHPTSMTSPSIIPLAARVRSATKCQPACDSPSLPRPSAPAKFLPTPKRQAMSSHGTLDRCDLAAPSLGGHQKPPWACLQVNGGTSTSRTSRTFPCWAPGRSSRRCYLPVLFYLIPFVRFPKVSSAGFRPAAHRLIN